MANTASLTIVFTYDLKSDYDPKDPNILSETIVEFAEEEIVVVISDALSSLGHKSVRIGNIAHLVQALVDGKHHEWDLAFNIAEGLRGSARAAQIPSLLEAYSVPCVFADARTMTLMHDKALTKVILREADVPTAPFTLVKACDSFNGFNSKTWKKKLGLDDNDEQPLDLFVKLNAEGTSKGLSETLRARTADAANQALKSLRAQFTGQDILVESFLDGREFSVSIAGTGDDAEILGVTEMLWPEDSPPFYTWYAKTKGEEGKDWIERGVDGKEDEEVTKAERVALEAWSAMGCRDGGRVDV